MAFDPADDAPRFTHDAFPTRRLDLCIDFYARFAALRLVRTRGEAPNRVVWLAPALTDAPIFVFVEEEGLPAAPPARDPLLRHLGFELPSRAAVDRLHARLAAAGHDPTEPRLVDEVVGYVTLARDPDGRVVEFTHGQDVSPACWD
jgi:catechol 2,3-dioxygenase-like lactoylglutathione lyase family enzyme